VEKINFLNKQFIQNPYPAYGEVREQNPIYRFFLPNGLPAWIVTRYDDAVEVLNDSRFVTNPPYMDDVDAASRPLHQAIVSRNLLSVNPTDHRRLRRLVQKAFTPRMIERLRGRIEEIACKLLDEVQDKGEMNLIADFAFPLPIIVICEMLGVPIEDQDKFREWSNAIMEGFNDPRFAEQSDKMMVAFVDYLQQLVSKRRIELREGLISDLIRVEDEGDVLSEHELYALVFVLIIAGHETTVNLIGNGIVALLEHPLQKELLKRRPELIHSAIEEVLRYNGPAEVSNIRWATKDVELRGTMIRKGEMLFVSFAAANRDPSQFPEPDALDITREANHHIAFGKGVHYCLGAPLARLEGEIAIGMLLQRMPDIRLKKPSSELEWRPGMIIRGLMEIPVLF